MADPTLKHNYPGKSEILENPSHKVTIMKNIHAFEGIPRIRVYSYFDSFESEMVKNFISSCYGIYLKSDFQIIDLCTFMI